VAVQHESIYKVDMTYRFEANSYNSSDNIKLCGNIRQITSQNSVTSIFYGLDSQGILISTSSKNKGHFSSPVLSDRLSSS